MSYVITYNGVEVPTYAQMIGGRIYASLRSNDTWAGFKANGTMPIWEGSGAAFQLLWPEADKERDSNGYLISGKNTEIAYLPPQVVTPAVMDGETVTTPAVMDDRVCLNMIISGDGLTLPGYEHLYPGLSLLDQAILMWMDAGGNDIAPVRSEEGKVLGGLALLDAATFSKPNLVWAM